MCEAEIQVRVFTGRSRDAGFAHSSPLANVLYRFKGVSFCVHSFCHANLPDAFRYALLMLPNVPVSMHMLRAPTLLAGL